MPTVIAPVVTIVHIVPALTVPHCTHTLAPRSTSLFTFASKSVALVHAHAFCSHMPFSCHAVFALTNTLCDAAPAIPSTVCIPESVILPVVADATSTLLLIFNASATALSFTVFT